MTKNLIYLLVTFETLMADWNLGLILTEEDFINRLDRLTSKISEEIKKQQLPVIQKNENN